MWATVNQTPYTADGLWWRDQAGVHAWLVGIKGTFEVSYDGDVELADEQEPVRTLPTFSGDPGNPSLRYEADILPLRPTTDIVLNATGFAPDGRPTTRFGAGFRLGGITKQVELHGPRFWVDRGGSRLAIGPANPAQTVPITWQNALGGYHRTATNPRDHLYEARNPCGTGAFGAAAAREGDRLPQVIDPADPSRPAGFSAIPIHWSPRSGLTGTYDAEWEAKVMPLLPSNWSRHSQQCAPKDQQTASYLRGGEQVDLVNLTPTGRLSFRLPKIGLTCLSLHDGRQVRHRPRLVCVIIEPDYFGDRGRLQMIWNSEIMIPREPDYLERTLIQERPYAA
ncbi:DUF2169 family type VI secretion system accessory protein [Rubellimicrobium arenae]|uniref:DUF2169 family type VI secretion system accessory protein n=1 Tax=Rubellimicrobium arenae TaxID=2817372 RepID=UPI001B313A4E|nr:DUF2169 domain-containing protein [Rubellimicrobium arenae]